MTPRDRKKIKSQWNKRSKLANQLATILNENKSLASYDTVIIGKQKYEVFVQSESYQSRLQKKLVKK